MKTRVKYDIKGFGSDANIFSAISDIWEKEEFKEVSVGDRAVYVYLSSLSERRADSNGWFEVTSKELERLRGCTRDTIYLARQALKKAGLIEEMDSVPSKKKNPSAKLEDFRASETYKGVRISIDNEGQLKLWSPGKVLSLQMTKEEGGLITDRKTEDRVRIEMVKKLIRRGGK